MASADKNIEKTQTAELTEELLKKILLEEKYVTADDMAKAEKYALDTHGRVTDYLYKEDLITKDILGQAVAEWHRLPYADLNSKPPSKEMVTKIPEELAASLRIVIAEEDGKSILIATDAPSEGFAAKLPEALGPVAVGKKVSLAYSLTEDVNAAFLHYRKTLDTRFAKIIAGKAKIAPEIIDEIVEDAVILRTSDIHFEPQGQDVLIRFRIDGVLHEAGRIQKVYYENVLNRIKVQAHMRIDEHMRAQDGAIRGTYGGVTVDMRVSILPTIDGEKVVMRLLSSYVKGFALSDLGLSASHEDMLRRAADKPFGMILVTGPTGSGKTTTLYALIKIINTPDINITTIEDPVEYKLLGVNQIQVNNDTNLTFANGLRSIVRQDPDIILVGEVRDPETAGIAVNAALTGHMMFSTFHANDAATTIPRLLDMGIEPFLLASTLELIIAQRLVRRICESCRVSESVRPRELADKHPSIVKYFSESAVTLYRGKGCPACSNTGYKGRIAIYEFIEVSEALEELILKRPGANDVWAVAQSAGARSLFEDGLEKVKSGHTTIDELLRVAQPPQDTHGQDKKKT